LSFNYGVVNYSRRLAPHNVGAFLGACVIICALNAFFAPSSISVLLLILSAIANAVYGYLSGICFYEGKLVALGLIQVATSLVKLMVPVIFGHGSLRIYQYTYISQAILLSLLVFIYRKKSPLTIDTKE